MPYHHWKKLITYLIIGVIIGYFGRGWFDGTYQDGWLDAVGDRGGKITVVENGEEIVKYQLIGTIKQINDDQLEVAVYNIQPRAARESGVRTVQVDKDAHIILSRQVDDYHYYSQIDPEGTDRLKSLANTMATDNLDRAERQSLAEEFKMLEDQLSTALQQAKIDLRQQISTTTDPSIKEQLQQKLASLNSRTLDSVISLADLRIGDRIIITSDKDIRYDNKFTANNIKIER